MWSRVITRALIACSGASINQYSKREFFLRCVGGSSSRSRVSSVNGRKLPRSAKAIEHPEEASSPGSGIKGDYSSEVQVQQSERRLKLKLSEELKQALRSGDKVRVSVIRLVLAAIKNAEIARQKQLVDADIRGLSAEEARQRQENIDAAEIARQSQLDDADILAIIAKEARQRQESIDAFKKANRDDLVAREQAEMAILQEYLPRQMSREEIIAEARRVITEVGARGPADKGKVMPKLVAQLKGKADGREINAVVTELLSSP